MDAKLFLKELKGLSHAEKIHRIDSEISRYNKYVNDLTRGLEQSEETKQYLLKEEGGRGTSFYDKDIPRLKANIKDKHKYLSFLHSLRNAPPSSFLQGYWPSLLFQKK